MAEHIHWKSTCNTKYLGAYALDDGKDMIVTIDDVKQETITGAKGEKEDCVVLYFKGDIKPMILNKTNMKAIAKVCGSPYIDDWVGKNIQLYGEMVSAFGETGLALRVRTFAPNGGGN